MDSPLSAPRYGGKRKARALAAGGVKKHKQTGPRLRVPTADVDVRRKPTDARRSGLCIAFGKPHDHHLLAACGGTWDCRVRWKDVSVKPRRAQVWLSGGDVQFLPKRDVLQFSGPAQKCFELGGLYTFECLALARHGPAHGDHNSRAPSETPKPTLMWTLENVRMCAGGGNKAGAAEKERAARLPPLHLGRTLLPIQPCANGGITVEFWLPHERLDALRSGAYYYQVGYRSGGGGGSAASASWDTQAAGGQELTVRLSPAAERVGAVELQGEGGFHNRKLRCTLFPAGRLQPGTAYDFATRLVQATAGPAEGSEWGKPWSCLIEESALALDRRDHELGHTCPATPTAAQSPAPVPPMPATQQRLDPDSDVSPASARAAVASAETPPVCFAVAFEWAKRHELTHASAAGFLLRAGNEGWPELARRLDYRASHPPIGVLQLRGAHDDGGEAPPPRVFMRDQTTQQVILDHALNAGTVVEFGAGDDTGSCGCVCNTPPNWDGDNTTREAGSGGGGCYFLYFTDCRNAVSFHNAITSLIASLSFHSAMNSLRWVVAE